MREVIITRAVVELPKGTQEKHSLFNNIYRNHIKMIFGVRGEFFTRNSHSCTAAQLATRGTVVVGIIMEHISMVAYHGAQYLSQ